MKNNLTKNLFSILIITPLLFFLGCDNPIATQNGNLIGTWFHDDSEYSIHEGQNTFLCISRREYNFLSNNDLKIERKEINKETSILLGYRYMAEGYYYLNGNQLTMVMDKAAQISDSLEHYFNNRSLRQISPLRTTVTYLINKDTLIFIYPPCGPTQSCITSGEVLYRRNN